MSQQPEYDEVRCDGCGQPTPRLDPPAERELCDDCYNAESRLDVRCQLAKMRQRDLNDATFTAAIRKMWQAS